MMRVPALNDLGGNFMFLFKACLKAATDDASLTSFGRLLHYAYCRGKEIDFSVVIPHGVHLKTLLYDGLS